MAMEIEMRAGPVYLADGATARPRLTRDSSQGVQDTHGRYQEAVIRGGVWTLATAVAGVTVAAANVVGAANAQPLVGIFNPVGSGYNAVILRATLIANSGTAGASGLVWGVAPPPTAVTATPGNGAINNFSLQTGGSKVGTFINAALTGITGGKLFRYIGGPTVGALAANANQTIIEETAGDIVCPPGGIVGIFAANAGTSPIIAASMTWEEVSV